ncbi:MAG TPA: hypothetical protein VF939_06980 [Puia sp.]
MTIEEYIEAILHHLEKADDCEEVEQIINRSIERMQFRNFTTHRVNNYLHKLYESLKKLTPTDFDSIHWCNIRWAVMYLNKITGNLKK